MAADDFIRIPVALARANPPGPGRALGRLRLSLAGPIRDLVARFGVAPGSAELSRGGGLLKMDKLSDEKRLEMAYLLALGRPPSDEMKLKALAYLEQSVAAEGKQRVEAWSDLCQALYATVEFRYVD